MHSMAPMSLDELAVAPVRLTVSAQLDAEPYAVFAELADPSLWYPLMRRSVWHTGATGGVGAEREVEVATLGKFRERMLVWDADARVCFTMTHTTSPLVARVAEDFRITRTSDGCRLDWDLAATPTTAGKLVMPALKPAMKIVMLRACRTLNKRARSYPKHRGTHTA